MKTYVLRTALLAATAVMLRAQPPDLVLTNGKIVTVDDRFSVAQAVAIRGDRIVAVGATPEITRLAGPQTRRQTVGIKRDFAKLRGVAEADGACVLLCSFDSFAILVATEDHGKFG